jgi:hypothetical protein
LPQDISVYINGILADESNSSQNYYGTRSITYILNREGGYLVNYPVVDMRVYSKTFTDIDVHDLYIMSMIIDNDGNILPRILNS